MTTKWWEKNERKRLADAGDYKEAWRRAEVEIEIERDKGINAGSLRDPADWPNDEDEDEGETCL